MKLLDFEHFSHEDYASQGNAILGIRDSGKSYTATLLAEELMLKGIPIIAFDPIGVWRYLKIGKKGNGFPVVVAGDGGDLPLSPESAQNIVHAAMKENVSLVIDLYSMKLSKADWKKIVEQCIRLLLYENKQYGLRHIFIEEAAEFCPQRIGPDQGKVYAEIEKLARMGGNASLGYTLINQRSEEVNKAVLELCDCLFLHRQKGRHSLTSLGKWLDVGNTSNSREIVKSLPSLPQGECWMWSSGSHAPVHIKVPEKRTVHPNRRNPQAVAKGIPTDVSAFVYRMKKSLYEAKQEQETKEVKEARGDKTKRKPKSKENENEPIISAVMNDNTRVTELESELQACRERLSAETASRKSLEQRLNMVQEKLRLVREMLAPQYKQLQKVFAEVDIAQDGSSADNAGWDVWLDKLKGKNREMLQVLIDRKRVSRSQLGLLIGMSANSGSFNTYLSKIKSLGLVRKDGNEFVLQSMN